ncbi:CoA transferase [Arthrobacter sp. D1-29]
MRPVVPGAELLGERAAIAGLKRAAPMSCGGAFQAVPANDGWFGLSLARDTDHRAVPALVEGDSDAEPWAAIKAWARTQSRGEAIERARLLDLAACAWPPEPSSRAPVIRGSEGGLHLRIERPLVVDFSALWAGPLCAHLLSMAGCDVIKVESAKRPDGARRGAAMFYDLLHAGHAAIHVDFEDAADLDRLRTLMSTASVVIESSRARSLRGLGLVAEEFVRAGVTWLSITARGRESNAPGFGDDVAVGAGLAIEEGGQVLPVGDAIADPLTGAVAATAAAEALLSERALLVDISMHDVASAAAAGGIAAHSVESVEGEWWVETERGRYPVAAPRARQAVGLAPELGADTAQWLR